MESSNSNQTWKELVDNNRDDSKLGAHLTDWFQKGDYERFVRLVVKETDNTLRDSHIGKSRYKGMYLSKRMPTHVSEENTTGQIPSEQWYPNKLLNHHRIPIDFNEWFYIVATYNPNINEESSFDEEMYNS